MNVVKSISCAALALIVSAAATLSVSAQTQTSDVHAVIDDTFNISIPETIEVGEYSTITATSVNVADGKQVKVSVTPTNDNGTITLTHSGNSGETIQVGFNNAEGVSTANTNNVIAQFGYGTELQTSQFYAFVFDSTGARAGDYTGSVMFSIDCE